MAREKKPCGRRFCPAPMRLLWPIKPIRVREIAAVYGVTGPEIDRRAEELGITDERPRRRTMKYSKQEFRALWADPSLTLEDIGQRLCMVPRVCTKHARQMGLPWRKGGAKPVYRFDDDFDAMWGARVSCREMAAYYGNCSKSLIGFEAKRRKLAPRPRAGKLTPIGRFLEDRATARFSAAMKRLAAIENIAPALRHRAEGENLSAKNIQAARLALQQRDAA